MRNWTVPRRRMARMPSSIREKAQSSTEPKATGVKMRRRASKIWIILLSVVVIEARNTKGRAFVPPRRDPKPP
jgi:hypothetical protein